MQDWKVRRRSYGESFVGCLAMIVIVLGGTIWAYFHFFQNKDLVHAGEPGTWIKGKPDNRQASIEYQRGMREKLFGSTEGVLKDAFKFLYDVKKGKCNDKNDFEQRYAENMTNLRNNCDELNQREVPPNFEKGHQIMAEAHRHTYFALLAMYKGFYEEDKKDTAKDYDEANKELTKAWGQFNAGRDIVKANFG